MNSEHQDIQANITSAANKLWEAAVTKQPCAPIRELIGSDNIQAAYRVQQINIERRRAAGQRITGAKIGLTSKAVQQQLGVDQPDFGWLCDSMQIPNGGSVSMSELMQPKAEAEIAFTLSRDVDENMNGDIQKIAAYIQCAVASIEIVGSRVKDWDIRIADTIADNASASHYVLGEMELPLKDIDLESARMTLNKNGMVASEGMGKACLGNPLNAVCWLADTMLEMGTPLKKGSIILAGALGPMLAVEAGDEVTASIDGLGTVSVSFKS